MKGMKYLLLTGLMGLTWSVYSQDIEVVKFDKIEKILEKKSSSLQIYNFWATWCKPCIVEMPYFEELSQSRKDKIEMNFISLDYADNVESKVKPFLAKKNIKSNVYLLDDIDYNAWIDKVDPRWSGAIPATVFITPSGKKIFYEKEFKKEELEKLIESLLNQ